MIAAVMFACSVSSTCGSVSTPASEIIDVPCCGAVMIGIVTCLPFQRRGFLSRRVSPRNTVLYRSPSISGPLLSRSRSTQSVESESAKAVSPALFSDYGC